MPRSTSPIFVLALLAIVLAGAVVVAQTSYTNEAEEITLKVENETVTVNYSVPVPTDAAENYSFHEFQDNETVRNASDDAVLTEGTDYTWNTSTGEITFIDTAATVEGTDANITYTYTRKIDTAIATRDVMATFIRISSFVLIGLAGLGLLFFATRFGGGGF